MQDVVRFWLDRGVDGFRLDAIDRLLKDPELRDDPPARTPFALPLDEEYARARAPLLDQQARGPRGARRAARRRRRRPARRRGLPAHGERSRPTSSTSTSPSASSSSVRPGSGALRGAIDAALAGRGARRLGAVQPRLPGGATRFGAGTRARLAALLLLTLPGAAFVYQGEEIGMADGPGADPPFDRAGRDGARHPMQWDASRHGGFSDRHAVAAAGRPRRAQRRRPGARPRLAAVALPRADRAAPRARPGASLIDAGDGGAGLRARGARGHAINPAVPRGEEPARAPEHGAVVLARIRPRTSARRAPCRASVAPAVWPLARPVWAGPTSAALPGRHRGQGGDA